MATHMRILLVIATAAVILLVGGLGIWGIWEGVRTLVTYLAGVPKELGAALIAAAATVFVSTLTVVLGRYFERKARIRCPLP